MSIKLDLKIFLFLLLFLITSQINIYILLMIFACIHELSHLLIGVLLGFKIQVIKITPVGLQVSFKIKCEEYNKKILKGNSLGVKKAIIAIAGPTTNFIICILLIILAKLGKVDFQNTFYQNIVYVNILIGLFNLIPIYPLDGGRILNEILHIFIGLKKSYKCTYIISKVSIIILTVVSSIAILYLQNISIIIILVYLWGLFIKESKVYYAKKQIENIENSLAQSEFYKMPCKPKKKVI